MNLVLENYTKDFLRNSIADFISSRFKSWHIPSEITKNECETIAIL